MNPDNLPTKQNLLAAKKNLKTANQGYDLLDKKHKVLMLEFVAIKNNVKLLQSQLNTTKEHAFLRLSAAKDELGYKKLKKLCDRVPDDTKLQMSTRIIMGVSIAEIIENDKKTTPSYSLAESTISLDEAFLAWTEVKVLIQKLAATQTTLRRISTEMQKTKKRAAALENIVIPMYETRIKYIADRLEERERDEFNMIATPTHKTRFAAVPHTTQSPRKQRD